MNTCASDTPVVPPRRARIPLSIFLLAVLAYTAVALNFDQPFISYAFAGAIVFLICAHIADRYWMAAAVVALGFSLLHSLVRVEINPGTDPVSLYLGMLGRGALLALGWAVIWADPKDEDQKRLYKTWLLPVAIVIFVLASLLALNLTVWASLPVLDTYVYIFDGSLGFQPSFLLGRIFAHYKLVADFERQVYCSLPIPVALVCVGYLKSKSPWRPLMILGTAGVLAYALYFLFPATGPLYVAGPTFPNFPHPFATLAQMRPHPIHLIVPAPRNAMPSLHVAWVTLLWFNSQPFSKLSRRLLLLYIFLTAVATLGTGEHYLADLVVAVPFSVAVQAIWSRVSGNIRHFVLIAASGLTFGWFALFRYGTQFFLWSPAFSWGCIVASTAISFFLYRYLDRADLHQADLHQGVVQSVNVQQKI